MGKSFTSKQNIEFVESVIATVTPRFQYLESSNHVWVLIGSYATNSNHDQSDLDLLCFTLEDEFHREKTNINGVNTSICMVPVNMLKEDGNDRTYRGYFSAKCLNPSHIFGENKSILNSLDTAMGEFIGDFSSFIGNIQGKSTFNHEQIATHTFSAFMSIHPGYESYFLSYFINKDFGHIWSELCSKVVNSLIKSEHIKERSKGKYRYVKGFRSFKEYNANRVIVAANHWSFGSIMHNNDFNFPKWYFENARAKLNRIDPNGSKMMHLEEFLLNKLESKKYIY